MMGWLDRDTAGDVDLLPAEAARDLNRPAHVATAPALSA
jgi:hypothetical protein